VISPVLMCCCCCCQSSLVAFIQLVGDRMALMPLIESTSWVIDNLHGMAAMMTVAAMPVVAAVMVGGGCGRGGGHDGRRDCVGLVRVGAVDKFVTWSSSYVCVRV